MCVFSIFKHFQSNPYYPNISFWILIIQSLYVWVTYDHTSIPCIYLNVMDVHIYKELLLSIEKSRAMCPRSGFLPFISSFDHQDRTSQTEFNLNMAKAT